MGCKTFTNDELIQIAQQDIINSFDTLFWGKNSLSADQPYYVIVEEKISKDYRYILFFEDHDSDEAVIILKRTSRDILVPLTIEEFLEDKKKSEQKSQP